ncbi:MAG: FAD-dependent monooxygenase [Clostridia bacterium]|nr:FAD-dependent monooxygenase [Clostridia bacterium]
MSLRTLSDIKLSLGKSETELIKLAEKKLGAKPKYFAIKKKSLDARNKSDIKFVYTIAFSAEEQPKRQREIETIPEYKRPEKPVLIVGSGPAGLFCALRLIERGIKPLVIERGASVEERERDIQTFIQTTMLNTQSNVQFGEGGAGTFSDGKLNTQTHSPLNQEVLETFVRFGAPEEILWLNKPHIGSDNLKKVVKNMREYIIANGGEVRFHTQLTDITIEKGEIKSVTLNGGEKTEPSALVLAIGHSARDTFETLRTRGVKMTAKDFAVGVRIEHLQKDIGFAQYGAAHTLLPAADYKLVSHASERAAFTFCMCPGGIVMPATSEECGVVTNGMSNYARNERNANAALIAQVRKTEFGKDIEKDPLAGVEFQRTIERAAYRVGGGTYAAPVQRVGDFLRDRTSDTFGEVKPTYAAGTVFADIRAVLPDFITSALKGAITDMDKRLHGFANPDALLTAAETRTSSPVRIERGDDLQSVSAKGIFPCGEGAGYAGGITSSAADGLRVADAVYARFLG